MAFKFIESAQTRQRAVNAPTSSRWSVPARYSRTASSSNDPTDQREVISKSRDTPIHRSWLFVTQRNRIGMRVEIDLILSAEPPNGVPNDRRRKLMAGKRDRHAPSYPSNGSAPSLPRQGRQLA
jgi:hypothetical protein